MVFFVLSDEEGELPVAAYPQVYREHRQMVNGTSSLIVEGIIQRERNVTSLLARRFWRLYDVAHLDSCPVLPRRLGHLPGTTRNTPHEANLELPPSTSPR
jgi:hypothetical protein